MDREATLRELERLRAEVHRLEAELAAPAPPAPDRAAGPRQAPGGSRDDGWPPPPFYVTYQVLAGCVLGMLGAATSLLFNVVGSVLIGQHPLRLIQVYLTFPLGDAGLQVNSGLTLAVGCCLYLGTGMLLGIPFQLVLAWLGERAPLRTRFVACTLLAVGVWLFNFYGVLSWLQPLLFGGDWIVRQIPWWVAALTHLVFGWTMLLVQPLGVFVPYRPPVPERSAG
jgi:hypothetical protein